MLFQYTTYSGAGTGLFQTLYQWGFLDAVLPFLLIFIIIFAILQKVALFKSEGDKPDKRINGMLGLIIGLMVVFPHVLNIYPKNADPILIINQILPGASVLLVAILLLAVMLGFTSGLPTLFIWAVVLVAVALMVFLIVTAIFPGFVPGFQFLKDPAKQAAILIILVMGLVVYFIMREPSGGGFKDWIKDWMGPQP